MRGIEMEGIIAAFITSGLTLIGVIITNMRNSQTIENKVMTSQAVTETKLDILTNDVKHLTSSVEKMPALEKDIENLTRRVDALEDK